MRQIGCLISVVGFLSILLSLVGLQLTFFWFLDAAGPRWVGYLLKAALIVIGIVIFRRADD